MEHQQEHIHDGFDEYQQDRTHGPTGIQGSRSRRWRSNPKLSLLSSGKRLPANQVAAAEQKLVRVHAKDWYVAHGRVPPLPPVHPAILQVIDEWFEAVDADGSRTLEHSELMAALKAAHIPCSDQTISEMIKLMDLNGDGVISWDEWHTFIAHEINNGKNFLTGEYVLPSGTSLNFGVMLGKLKRGKLMHDVLQSRTARSKWVQVASNPEQLRTEMATMANAAQAAANISCLLSADGKKAADSQHQQGEDDEVNMATPRTHAAEKMLNSLSKEHRLRRSMRLRPGGMEQAEATTSGNVPRAPFLAEAQQPRLRRDTRGSYCCDYTSLNGGLSQPVPAGAARRHSVTLPSSFSSPNLLKAAGTLPDISLADGQLASRPAMKRGIDTEQTGGGSTLPSHGMVMAMMMQKTDMCLSKSAASLRWPSSSSGPLTTKKVSLGKSWTTADSKGSPGQDSVKQQVKLPML